MDETKLNKYAELKKELDVIDLEYEKDTEQLTNKIKELSEAKKQLYDSKYNDQIKKISTEIEELKFEITKNWDLKEKSVKTDQGTFTMKETQDINIHNKMELVKDLDKKDMLVQSIKSFNDTFLKSILKTGVMLPGANLETKKILAYTQNK